ncbi:hypothetical protein BLS_003577 [Venturia inaequalis]|uniref:Uncharacterized protein n=1 Tax=Venturia inaequalis TaxID=5025 RepID=A0A8H3YI14_VENIN|nr:hypothetical protein BLS_003577 [Venturia inaequalis]
MVELGQMVKAFGVVVKPTAKKEEIISAIVARYITRLKENFLRLGRPPNEPDTNVETIEDSDIEIEIKLEISSTLIEASTSNKDHSVAVPKDNDEHTNGTSRRDDDRPDHDYYASGKYRSRKFGDTEFSTGDHDNHDYPVRKHKSRNYCGYDQVEDYRSYDRVEDYRHHHGHGQAQYPSGNTYD